MKLATGYKKGAAQINLQNPCLGRILFLSFINFWICHTGYAQQGTGLKIKWLFKFIIDSSQNTCTTQLPDLYFDLIKNWDIFEQTNFREYSFESSQCSLKHEILAILLVSPNWIDPNHNFISKNYAYDFGVYFQNMHFNWYTLCIKNSAPSI